MLLGLTFTLTSIPNVDRMTTIPALSRAAIIHGYAAAPDDHWFPWLAARLEEAGIATRIPPLPESDAPDRDRWTAAVEAVVGTPARDSVLVAHSLGCLAVLRHLSGLSGSWRLGSLVLVSGFVDPLPALPQLDAFVDGEVDPAIVLGRVDRLTVIRSDADPYVPTTHTDRLARLLHTTPVVVEGAGHFLASDGVDALPQALEAVVANVG